MSKINTLSNSETFLKDIVNKINKDNKGRVAPLQKQYDSLYKEISAMQDKKNKILGLKDTTK